MKKRTVRKITPARHHSFDQQFWPVLVALTVLSGIAVGAILTILRGPWMWGSLLLLPVLAAAAIFFLFNLDDTRLRRSLQFAIILSLAAHLFVMVFASVVNIFGNPYQPTAKQVSPRKIRTIEIADQATTYVWNETNARETPEPVVEAERQKTPTTDVAPQTTPVEQTEPSRTPQLVRSETPAMSIPRQSRELSQRRRQMRESQPQSSQLLQGAEKSARTAKRIENPTPSPTTPPAPKVAQREQPSPPAAKPASQPKSIDIQRQTRAAPNTERAVTPSAAAAAQAAAQPAKPVVTTEPPARRSPDRTPRPVDQLAATTPAESATPSSRPSTARTRRATPSIPRQNKPAPVAPAVAKAETSVARDATPAKSSSDVARRQVVTESVKSAITNRPQTKLSQQTQIASSVERRPANEIRPSISTDSSMMVTPRRATIETKVATSPIALEQPSRAPESKAAARDLDSKTLSVTRSISGVAGVGRSNNLDRFAGGQKSTAVRASDSARRERTTSNVDVSRMLSSSQRSNARRAAGVAPTPTSVFEANTAAPAKVAGSRTPTDQSVESSAAQIDSASSTNREKFAAQRGTAEIDFGPTKIVMEEQRQRRSGGGQPDVSQLDPNLTRRSRDRADARPTLAAELASDVAAPSNQSTTPPAADAVESSQTASVTTRQGDTAALTGERWEAATAGELSEPGRSELAELLAADRRRDSEERAESTWKLTEEDDEELRRGNKRTRVARAPVAKPLTNLGIEAALGDADATGAVAAETSDPAESEAATLVQRTNAATSDSGLAREVAQVPSQQSAATAIDSALANDRARAETGSSRGDQTGENSNANTGELAAMLKDTIANGRERPATTPATGDLATELPELGEFAAATEESTAERLAALDSRALDVARDDQATKKELQGSKLEILALEGPAGLDVRPDEFIGVMMRPSSRESRQLQPELKNRFRNPKFGGQLAVNPDLVVAEKAFRGRSPSSLSSVAEPSTEAAIQLGLEFLARYQAPDGRWTLTGFDLGEPQRRSQLDSDTAATGLVLLAFQGAGYNHQEFKYAQQLDGAIEWLIANQAADGGLYVPTDNRSNDACRLYSHGIATLALTEAYGMTQDPRLKEPAQKALDYIATSQDPRKGGWRYFDEPGRKSADTSVSGWMMMALQSGRMAGLEADKECLDGIGDWLDVAATPDNPSLYRYNPYAVDSKGVSMIVSREQGKRATASMTAVGLLMRIYAGWERNDPRLIAGAEYLLETQMPSDSTPQERDTYYWYYATQVLKHIDGPMWERWNNQLRPLLTRSQVQTGELAGSWHPYRPVPDRWGPFGGRLYVTTMNLLSLEVRHRMLPIYESEKLAPVVQGFIETDAPGEPSEPSPMAADPAKKEAPSKETPAVAPAVAPVVVPAVAEAVEAVQPLVPPRGLTQSLPTATDADNQADRAAAIAIEQLGQERGVANLERRGTDLQPTIGKELSRDQVVESAVRKQRQQTPPPSLEAEASLTGRTLEANRPSQRVLPSIEPPARRSRGLPSLDLQPAEMPTPAVASTPKPTPTPELVYSSISGTVTLDGKPLDNAKVEFVPVDEQGVAVSARTDAAGRFEISDRGNTQRKGIVVADYKIAVTTYVESPDINMIDLVERVPEKYNKATRLRLKIKPEAQNVTIKLESR